MKSLVASIFALSLLFCIKLTAQPEGKLFFNSTLQGQGYVFGYVDFPSGQYNVVDSVSGSDLAIHGDKIYVAGGDMFSVPGDVYVYDLLTLQKDTTLVNTHARAVEIWENNLVVLSSEAPYLRVFDIENHFTPLFSVLDTNVIKGGPADMRVMDDRAYVIADNKAIIVDMDLEDTLAVVRIIPEQFYRAAAYISVLKEKLYIETTYYTAIPRSDYFRLDPVTLQVDSIYHGVVVWSGSHPVEAGDKLYTFQYDSHFDAVVDSFVISPSGLFDQWAIAYDTTSSSVFAFDLQNKGIVIEGIGGPSRFISVPGNLYSAIFYKKTNTGVEESLLRKPQLSLFPNPTADRLTITLDQPHKVSSLRVFNSKGQIVLEKPYQGFAASFDLEVSNLSRGGYFLEVAYEEERVRSSFVKW